MLDKTHNIANEKSSSSYMTSEMLPGDINPDARPELYPGHGDIVVRPRYCLACCWNCMQCCVLACARPTAP